jgi:Ca-activated chloride channel homolog
MRRISPAVFTLILLAGAARAAQPEDARSTTASPISAEERRWLQEKVAALATPEEKKIYLSLPAPYQREAFRAEFWRIREREGLKPPFGPGFRALYENRLEVANQKYGGWKSDRGRIVLALGEPVQVVEVQCPRYRPIQLWTVEAPAGGVEPVRLVFYQDFAGSLWKLWTPALGFEVLASPTVAAGGPPAAGICTDTEADDLRRALSVLHSSGSLGSLSLVVDWTGFPPPPEQDWPGWQAKFVAGGVLTEEQKKKISLEAPKAEPPAAPSRKLSRSERTKIAKALPERYREWLEEVDLILTDKERDVFLQIAESVERDKFIEEFWHRRSLDKDGLRTNFHETFRERVEYARENFKDLGSDAAKIYILNGPPDAVVAVNCQEVFVPTRIWYYERLEALKSKAYLIFYLPYGLAGGWKLWLPIDGTEKLAIRAGVPNFAAAEGQCFESRTLAQAIAFETALLGTGASGMAEAAKMFVPPLVETEGIDRFLGLTTQVSPDARPLAVQKSVLFPEERDNKIACDISIVIPRTELALRELGVEKFYDIDVVGEVVRNERLIDNFKYRFDIPWEEGGENIPLTLRRYLYPGKYELRLKAADANRKAEGRLVEAFDVPEKPEAPIAPAVTATARPRSASVDAGFRPSAISILPPAREILTGLARFETKAAEGIRTVEFYLDGVKVITRTRLPFEADLNLGPVPRRHTIRAAAYDGQGRLVGEDERALNEGNESFRVRITSPPRGTRANGPVNVTADVAVPEGESLSKMEFYSNDRRVATLYQAPWQQIVPVAKTGSLGYVRVVGTLEDGVVAEDLRYINAPEYISEVNVDAVELYTTVTRNNRPVEGLEAKNFRILEDGKPQQIAQFERMTNIPLTVGVAIDTSASMIDNLPEAEKAAVDFLDSTLAGKDRAFTMSFDDTPYTLCKLTADRSRLDRSFAGLRAEGSTALYDAIVYALFQFQGVKGKRALVLLTDGKDTTSQYDFDTLLDYVKKAGVSVYAIGLHIAGTELEVKSKLHRISETSGGTTFYVDSPKNLARVYRQINDELRTQYLLTYYSSGAGGSNKWRKVEVKTDPSTLVARTISGYFP